MKHKGVTCIVSIDRQAHIVYVVFRDCNLIYILVSETQKGWTILALFSIC